VQQDMSCKNYLSKCLKTLNIVIPYCASMHITLYFCNFTYLFISANPGYSAIFQFNFIFCVVQ